MGCNICGRNSCASWMHSIEEQEEFESVNNMNESALKREVIELRREIAELKGVRLVEE